MAVSIDAAGRSELLATARNTGVFLLILLIAAAIATPYASAQAPGLSFRSRSFITPFPQTERYHLHVIGDGLAEGLASGMQQAFEKDGSIRVINSAKPANGMARPDRNWAAEIDELIKQQPMHIAVVMMGLNDVRSMHLPDGRYVRWNDKDNKGWRDAYAKEIDRLIKALKDRNVAVYWVGLPIMSDPKMNEPMAFINDIIRERTYIGNVKFIDAWNGFTDQSGNFSAYGPDLTGQTQRLREPDGQSFTARGNAKLANYVEIILRRDLNEARAERNIPLAGDEEEQARLIPKAETAKDAKDGKNPAAQWMPEQKPGDNPAQKPGAKELPAIKPESQKTPVPETATQSPQQQPPVLQPSLRPNEGPQGETIMGDSSEGVTALATVSPIADLNAAIDAGERRLPVSERLYYKALVKGEALKPKPGRADDFRWPRS